MPFPLRPYQEDEVAAVLAARAAGRTSALLQSPTGSGKTVTSAELARRVGGRCLFLVNRDVLVKQTVEKFGEVWPDASAGVVKAERDETGRHVTVASVQTISRASRLARVIESGPYELVVWDEVHHAVSDSYKAVRAALDGAGWAPPPFHLGLTATPHRHDGASLEPLFGASPVHANSLIDLINQGYLSPIHGERATLHIDLDGIPTRNGDFVDKYLRRVMDDPKISAQIADVWAAKARNRKSIAFCVDVQHAVNLAATLRERIGARVDTIHGGTPDGERERMLGEFREGEIDVLTSVDVVSEGFDEPSAECAIMARPTLSHTWYMQAVGRIARRSPTTGKVDALVLDFVGNSKKHSIWQLPALFGLDDVQGADGAGNGEPRPEDENPDEVPRVLSAVATTESFDVCAAPKVGTFHWTKTPYGHALSIPVRDLGFVLLRPDAGGRVHVVYYAGRDGGVPEICTTHPISKDLAAGMAEEKVRNLLKARADRQAFFDGDQFYRPDPEGVMDRAADWRARPPTEKQRLLLNRYEIAVPLTSGEASDVITAYVVEQEIRRSEPATAKQIWFLQQHGYDASKITKRQANKLIGVLKEHERRALADRIEGR